MRKWYSSIFLLNGVLVFGTVVNCSLLAQSQGSQHAAVLVPDSTVERAQDKGIRAHTNHLIRLQANPTPNALSPSGETPQTIRPVYKLPSTGGSQKIAIVDAFDYPTAENDLRVFSAKFGLPLCTTANGCFKKVYANGTKSDFGTRFTVMKMLAAFVPDFRSQETFWGVAALEALSCPRGTLTWESAPPPPF